MSEETTTWIDPAFGLVLSPMSAAAAMSLELGLRDQQRLRLRSVALQAGPLR